MKYRIEDIPDNRIMQAVVDRLLPLVPFMRREKALRYTHLHGQYCCLRSWELLHELLMESGMLVAGVPLRELNYAEDAYGKPRLVGVGGWQDGVGSQQGVIGDFSISHTKNAIAVAVSDGAVGIDVEEVVPVRRVEDRHFLDRTMSAAEQVQIRTATDPCVRFTAFWTQKEALYKAKGTGINMDTLSTVLEGQHDYSLQTIVRKGYVCSIARAIEDL